jgi:hypothetical protein
VITVPGNVISVLNTSILFYYLMVRASSSVISASASILSQPNDPSKDSCLTKRCADIIARHQLIFETPKKDFSRIFSTFGLTLGLLSQSFIMGPLRWRHDTQDNDIYQKDTQENDVQHNNKNDST